MCRESSQASLAVKWTRKLSAACPWPSWRPSTYGGGMKNVGFNYMLCMFYLRSAFNCGRLRALHCTNAKLRARLFLPTDLPAVRLQLATSRAHLIQTR